MLKMIGTFAVLLSIFPRNLSAQDTPPENCDSSDCDGAGEPLFLTPYIEDKNWPRQEIRNMAKVNYPEFGDVESFAGYLTINKTYNSNLFFWYFAAEENPSKAPVVLWIQGGPGVSDMLGLFYELGPFEIDADHRLHKRNLTWSRYHNLIFIDTPLGAGYSFTDDEAGYATNKEQVGQNLHEAMMQLYELFEWGDDLDFWITGESYGGKFVTTLAYQIHKTQLANTARVHLPLKGILYGDCFCDPINQLNIGDYFYHIGLVDNHGLDQFNEMEEQIAKCIDERNMDAAFDLFANMILVRIRPEALLHNLTGYNAMFNFLKSNDIKGDEILKRIDFVMKNSSLRNALHGGNQEFLNTGPNAIEQHKLDFMESVAPLLNELLDNYIVTIYTGQLDIVVPYVISLNYIENLQFAGAEEYKVAKRNIWHVDGQIAGYTKQAGNLIEIMVRNAGHETPKDQLKFVHDILYQLTRFQSVT